MTDKRFNVILKDLDLKIKRLIKINNKRYIDAKEELKMLMFRKYHGARSHCYAETESVTFKVALFHWFKT